MGNLKEADQISGSPTRAHFSQIFKDAPCSKLLERKCFLQVQQLGPNDGPMVSVLQPLGIQ